MDRRMPPTGTVLAKRCEATDREITVKNSRVLQVSQVLKIGGELVLVRECHDPVVTVDRGFGGTVATRHNPRVTVVILGVAMPENTYMPPAMTGG